MRCIVKKTLQIIKDTGNDYVVKVKGNQPTLRRSVEKVAQKQRPYSVCRQIQRSRGRLEKRVTRVFDACGRLPDGWPCVNRIIHIQRSFWRKEGLHKRHSYYICSLKSEDAWLYANGIRGHWKIENRLHWVKDVIMNEDNAGIKSGQGAENLSVFKNIAINIYRKHDFDSIKRATMFFANNIKELLRLLRT